MAFPFRKILCLDRTEAGKAMRDPLVTVGPSTTLREAARLLREHQLGGLAVVEEGKPAGVITTADMLGALAAEESATRHYQLNSTS